MGKHSRERSCVEEDLYRLDPAILCVNPISAGNSPGGCIGCKVVHEADVVAFDERLPPVYPCDYLGEPSDRFNVVVSVVELVELVYGTRE